MFNIYCEGENLDKFTKNNIFMFIRGSKLES